MRMTRAVRGQSMAEYAVLLGIVLGAAIAMQTFIRMRLQGGMQSATVGYQTAVQGGGLTANPFEDPDRLVNSQSGSDMNMTAATVGGVESTSGSATGARKR